MALRVLPVGKTESFDNDDDDLLESFGFFVVALTRDGFDEALPELLHTISVYEKITRITR